MSEQKPSILVTGAAGKLAQHVIGRMKEHYRIVGVDFREKSPYDEKIVDYYITDFSKRGFENIFRKHTLDGLLHLGRIQVSQSGKNRRYNTNVLGTKQLFELSHKYHVKKVVLLSTYHVYGAHPYNPSLIDEDFPLKAGNLSSSLSDLVEVENLATINALRHTDMQVTLLRPTNILGPGVKNSISMLLQRKLAPALIGFSPLMQFIHVQDVADAIVEAYLQDKPGVYNLAPNEFITLHDAMERCGCKLLPVPSFPASIPATISRMWGAREFHPDLLNYYRYPVVIDGRLFHETFNTLPKQPLADIFEYYRRLKSP